MKLTRSTSLTAAATILLSGLAVASSASAADPTYPTGTFSVDRTSKYYYVSRVDDYPPGAFFTLTRTSLSDDTTAAADIVVKVVLNDPNYPLQRPMLWANTTAPIEFNYDRVGTYHPQLWLTDADHNTTVLDLPALSVVPDDTPPVTTLARPKPANSLAAWRVLHGTVADHGIGVLWINLQILQKRRGTWYFYVLDTHRWTRGKATLAATRKNYRSSNIAAYHSPDGPWHTPRIAGLTKSPTAVCFNGIDQNEQRGTAKCITGRITRR